MRRGIRATGKQLEQLDREAPSGNETLSGAEAPLSGRRGGEKRHWGVRKRGAARYPVKIRLEMTASVRGGTHWGWEKKRGGVSAGLMIFLLTGSGEGGICVAYPLTLGAKN